MKTTTDSNTLSCDKLPEETEPVIQQVEEIVSNPDMNSKEKAVCIVQELSVAQEMFSGPIPSPKIMEGYAKLIPDAPERILKMAEEQHKHRMELEAIVVPRQSKQSAIGQRFAFILCILMICLAAFAIYKEANGVATAIVTITIVACAALFITGKLAMRKDLADKSEE